MTSPVWDVFVSYKSGTDQGAAFELVAALEERGVKCWIAPRDVTTTAQMLVSRGILKRAGYDDAIPFAVEHSSSMVIVVSGEAMTSDHIKDEINLGKEARIPFFPVRVADAPLIGSFKYHLGREQWFDCFDGTGPARFVTVASAIASFLGVPRGHADTVVEPTPDRTDGTGVVVEPEPASLAPGIMEEPTPPEPLLEPAPEPAQEPAPLIVDAGTPGRLDPRIFAELQSLAQRLRNEGELLPQEELLRCHARFTERFGPGVLASLEGERLLRTMYDGSSRDSLAYWLERGDRDHPAGTFGLISGGTPLAVFGLYRRSGMDVWVAGRHHTESREVSLAEAINLVGQFRDELLAAWRILEQFPTTTEDGPYAALQAELDLAAPELSRRAWLHKYLHMLRPDVLDDFHNEELQEAHLVSLLEVPPPGRGRYLRAGRYVRIARELDLPINHLAKVLNTRRRTAHREYWMAPPASISRREGEVHLVYARPLPAGTVVVTSDGRDVTAIGRLLADYVPQGAPGVEVWTPVQWLDQGRWRLPEAERGGESVKRVTSPANRVAIERRVLAASRS